MNIHYIQHEPFEDLGCIRDWFSTKSHTISHTHLWENDTFPTAENIDMLIIMGGSISAYDDAIVPWLTKEKKFISDCIKANKKVLGICLGSQLLASVLGARVYPGSKKEIGWFPITMNPLVTSNTLFDFFPKKFTTMHWHGDTFELPTNATLIASSDLTLHQGFIYNNKVVALQFHPEMNQEAILGMIVETGELIPDTYVQTIKEIKVNFSYCKENNAMMFTLLDRLSES